MYCNASIIIIRITGVISIVPKFGINLLIILNDGSINLNKKFIIMDITRLLMLITLNDTNILTIT